MKLHVLETLAELHELHRYLEDKEYVAYDSETTGLTKEAKVIGFSICADEDEAFYVVLKKWDKNQSKLVQTEITDNAVHWFLMNLYNKKLIMHNSVFDCSQAFNNFGIDLMPSLHTDTMILAHLLNENRRVGLKDLARTMFGDNSTKEQAEMRESVLANGGKLTKDTYEMYKCDSTIMGKYGAKDAALTLKLFYALVPELYSQGLEDFFYTQESMPLLKGPTYELNTVGLKVDTQGLTNLKKQLEAECLEAKDFIYAEIHEHIKNKYPGTNKRNTFNIESNQQLAWLLFIELKFDYKTLTKEGKTVCKAMGLKLPYAPAARRDFIDHCIVSKGNTYQPEASIFMPNGGKKKVRAKKIKDPWCYIAADKKTLTALADRRKWIARLLEYKRKMKILNTYVIGLEERIQYGIINPSFLQHGTSSGRYSSRAPNFQNLPRDDKRVKAVIASRPGKVFVGADYSQLEPRVFAYFSKDKRLLAAFASSDDFYSVIGMAVYGKYDCTPKKDGEENAFGIKYKKLRDMIKVFALAAVYGATAHRLMEQTGKSSEDTQEDMDRYFEAFKGVAQFMKDTHKSVKKHGEVRSLFNRPRRMPEAKKFDKIYGNVEHLELPYEARNVLNLAVNHIIQSTGASIVNRAMIRAYELFRQAGIICKFVLQVHDSIVIECDEKDAEDVSVLLQEAMENTIDLKTIKLEAIPKIGFTLAEV